MPKLIVQFKHASALNDRRGYRGTVTLQEDHPAPLQIIEAESEAAKPWDQAHDFVRANPEASFAEPDIDAAGEDMARAMTAEQEKLGHTADSYYDYISYWPHPSQKSVWHLEDSHSELLSARHHVQSLGIKNKIRIAHLDTGYTSRHASFPKDIINTALQRNFVEGEEDRLLNAEDPLVAGTLKMPGHGTGTLSILAGAKMKIDPYDFDDYLGLHDMVEIVPIRIASSVVLFQSAAFVKAMDYILHELNTREDTRVHIITMSMGGLPVKAWADLVNEAYEQGVFMVTAAGNNYKKLPTRTLVYPARFKRVVAACGVTYDKSPYHKRHADSSLHIMEGNFGPARLMDTAIAAYTPNVIWATYRYPDVVGIRGDGTSSATPQVAAAAALYYAKYYEELQALEEPWMRVEAIRHALFSQAEKAISNAYDPKDYARFYGNGTLKARQMLEVPVITPERSQKKVRDNTLFAFIRLILGTRQLQEELTEDDMLETELMQLVLSDPRLQELLQNEELGIESMSDDERRAFSLLVLDNPNASDALKVKMAAVLSSIN